MVSSFLWNNFVYGGEGGGIKKKNHSIVYARQTLYEVC